MDLLIEKGSTINATINMMPVRIPQIDIKKDKETQPFTGKIICQTIIFLLMERNRKKVVSLKKIPALESIKATPVKQKVKLFISRCLIGWIRISVLLLR